eukprot:SAG11_NODE_523_length_8775_cov_29.592900_4_plen_152_part_00
MFRCVDVQRRVAHNVGSKNKQLVETTLELATKVGGGEVVSRLVEDLKDDSEPYRKMVMEAIDAIVGKLGAADVDSRLEEQLIDGIMYAFQEQTTVSQVNGDSMTLSHRWPCHTASLLMYLSCICRIGLLLALLPLHFESSIAVHPPPLKKV